MGNNIGSFAKENKDEYPGLPTYLQCQSNAFVTGILTLFVGGSVTFFGQEKLAKFVPWSKKSFILPAIAVGSCLSYSVVRRKTTECQEMWIAIEDRRTYLTRLEEQGPIDVKDFDRKKLFDATKDPWIKEEEEEDEK